MRWSRVSVAGLIFGIVGVAVSTSASQSSARQSATPQEDVLPALLVEVRGLRAAMEQMASAGPRVQLALGRVQLQEQRVNNLMRRIEEGRSHLGDAQRKYDQMQQQLRGLQEALRDPAPNGPPAAELQAMQRDSERELARLCRRRSAADRRNVGDGRGPRRRAGPVGRSQSAHGGTGAVAGAAVSAPAHRGPMTLQPAEAREGTSNQPDFSTASARYQAPRSPVLVFWRTMSL